MFPALAGRFFTTGPPGTPLIFFFQLEYSCFSVPPYPEWTCCMHTYSPSLPSLPPTTEVVTPPGAPCALRQAPSSSLFGGRSCIHSSSSLPAHPTLPVSPCPCVRSAHLCVQSRSANSLSLGTGPLSTWKHSTFCYLQWRRKWFYSFALWLKILLSHLSPSYDPPSPRLWLRGLIFMTAITKFLQPRCIITMQFIILKFFGHKCVMDPYRLKSGVSSLCSLSGGSGENLLPAHSGCCFNSVPYGYRSQIEVPLQAVRWGAFPALTGHLLSLAGSILPSIFKVATASGGLTSHLSDPLPCFPLPFLKTCVIRVIPPWIPTTQCP